MLMDLANPYHLRQVSFNDVLGLSVFTAPDSGRFNGYNSPEMRSFQAYF